MSSIEAATQAMPTDSWFQDFTVGMKWRHARGATLDLVEGQMLAKLVVNTAQEHWNDHAMEGSPWGERRLVFGMATGSLTIGLTSQDTARHALKEVRLDGMRMISPVFHGDTIYAYSEVLSTSDVEAEDAGVVEFRHWGAKPDGQVVFTCTREVLISRDPSRPSQEVT